MTAESSSKRQTDAQRWNRHIAGCAVSIRQTGKWGGYHDLAERAYCTIRDVHVPNPLWTYCLNVLTRQAVPLGPILASGLYENGYVRIPWHGHHEPRQKN